MKIRMTKRVQIHDLDAHPAAYLEVGEELVVIAVAFKAPCQVFSARHEGRTDDVYVRVMRDECEILPPHTDDDAYCVSCGEGIAPGDCCKSKKACGHHCDCSWDQDQCCYCGRTEFDEEVA